MAHIRKVRAGWYTIDNVDAEGCHIDIHNSRGEWEVNVGRPVCGRLGDSRKVGHLFTFKGAKEFARAFHAYYTDDTGNTPSPSILDFD